MIPIVFLIKTRFLSLIFKEGVENPYEFHVLFEKAVILYFNITSCLENKQKLPIVFRNKLQTLKVGLLMLVGDRCRRRTLTWQRKGGQSPLRGKGAAIMSLKSPVSRH